MLTSSKVWLVLVNWRNAPDTIACLEALLESGDDSITGVAVVDNGSGDGSVPSLVDWAHRHDLALTAAELPDNWADAQQCKVLRNTGISRFRLVLIAGERNLGFAGGNNLAIRYVQQFDDYSAVLCLNNDTVPNPGAVDAMARRLSATGAGMCGATVVYWHPPQRVQALGGARYWPWLGRAAHIGAGAGPDVPRDAAAVEAQLGYVMGAALMISRACLEDIGLMEERYFLYYEEIDWAVRARQRRWRLVYAPDAVIFHKEGGSIGSSTQTARRSHLSEYCLLRSRLAFTRKFYPQWLPTVFAYSVFQLSRNLMRGDLARVRVQWAALSGRAFAPVGRRT
jgi:GT2 family glycosyltransferase